MLLILSLIGYVGTDVFSSHNLKYYKETEWVKTTTTVEKASKCFYHSFYLNLADEHLTVIPQSDNFISYFNKQVQVHLIAQIKSGLKKAPINLLINKLYSPRKSIADYSFSC